MHFALINQTSELGLQVLAYLALSGASGPVPPRIIAEYIGASPTYTSKVSNLLARAGIVRAQRGANGGVLLERKTNTITVLEVVEACQGKFLADYCTPHDNLDEVCGFHKAMHELHASIIRVLGKWTIADLVAQPCPTEAIIDTVDCRMKWCKGLLNKKAFTKRNY